MDAETMKFISDMTGSLAWPIVVAGAILYFKTAIIERLESLTEVSLPGGVEATFGRGLEKVKEAVAEVTASAGWTEGAETFEATANVAPPSQQVHADLELRYNMAAANPAADDPEALRVNATGVVMESWINLENVLRSFAAQKLSISEMRKLDRDVGRLVLLLGTRGLLSENVIDPIMKLRHLRNMAAHNALSIPPSEAREYADTATSLTNMLLRQTAQ